LPAQAAWAPLSLDSSLQRRPRVTTPAPVIGKLEQLPFELLPWEDFERIQWRIMRDVEGLRYAQVYGDRGQSQYGLDVVALAPDQSGVALQSKRYKQFGPAQLKAAVKKFRTTSRPFAVNRLIIGVSREVKSTKSVETLAELRKSLYPVGLDLWDKQELSRLLRSAPEIVIEFFGMPTAEAFCMPFELEPVYVPPADAVAVREALARTPEEVTGAGALLDAARKESTDPLRALNLVEQAQAGLHAAGFKSYAAQHEAERVRLLLELGRADEAARRTLDEFWTALDQGLTTTAQITQRRLHDLVSGGEEHSSVRQAIEVTDAALDLYMNPLASLPEATSLMIGEPVDRLRLTLLAGESALASDDLEWLARGKLSLTSLAEVATTERILRTRLRLLAAEASGDWSKILEDARRLSLGHDLLGLVTARYARCRALDQRFEEADALWDEAAGDACLAQRWPDAAIWMFSRRAFRARWKPFTSDELLPLQTALRDMGPARRIVPVSDGAYADALEGLRTRKLRSAAISAQRALRDAVATSDWVAEGRARQVLAAIFKESNEPELAAHHLARAGDVTAIKELGEAFPRRFIDATPDLDAPNYWTVGTAYRLIAKQADLVPDDLVGKVAARILAELTAAETGHLPDLRAFSTSRYLGALSALAGIAHRLTMSQGDAVLTHFEAQPPMGVDHYRLHDEDEATIVARIGLSQSTLVQRAITHLVPLLARSQSARGNMTQRAVDKYIELARDHLARYACEGNSWAQETLAFHDSEANAPEVVEEALNRLTTPLNHQPGVYSMGTGAVGDSMLVRALPPTRLEPAIAELLRRANNPHVGSSDRGQYLIAASNLAHQLDEADRDKHFASALLCASSPTPSEHDDFERQYSHKLGAMRIANANHNSRDKAIFLAACLATNDAQRAQVRSLAYALLDAEVDSDYWLTRGLQQLDGAVKDDVGFLSGQGWAFRSLAGILWARHGGPPQVGMKLANDLDVRVRRAFAEALANSEVKKLHEYARVRLAHDPCYSVRMALNENNEASTM
jgi:hypothetical protein